MRLTSPAFQHNGTIPSKYTCDGLDVNPPLQISDVPSEAKSLALIADDPDAPTGIWTHWLVWNINPHIVEIEEDSVPEGAVEGNTNFGNPGYGGPCPPSGEHRYYFKLYALDSPLGLQEGATRDELEASMEHHIIDETELAARYSRH